MLTIRATRSLPAIVGYVLLCALTACAGGGGNGSGSVGENRAAPEGSPPAAPVLGVAFSGRQLHFTWLAATDATYYRIYLDPDGPSGLTQLVGNVTNTSFTRDIAVHRVNWSAARYRLQACNAAGCSASNVVSTRIAVLQAIGYFKATNTAASDNSAVSLALSGDGNTLAVGAPDESGGASGIGGDSAGSHGAAGSGAVHVFARRENAWSQQAYLKASNTSAGDAFGISVSLSSSGNTLAVGAYLEDGPATGINGNQGRMADNNSNAGAVYVFTRSDGNWSQQAYVKASNTHANAYFGRAVSLNGNGNTLAVGAIGERTGALDAGAVYVFGRSASGWSQQAFVKASTILAGAHFGAFVTLNGSGNTLAVGAPEEFNGANAGGIVYVFTLGGGVWSQQAHVIGPNTTPFDAFDYSVASSSDGATLVPGAVTEGSGAIGKGANQAP